MASSSEPAALLHTSELDPVQLSKMACQLYTGQSKLRSDDENGLSFLKDNSPSGHIVIGKVTLQSRSPNRAFK